MPEEQFHKLFTSITRDMADGALARLLGCPGFAYEKYSDAYGTLTRLRFPRRHVMLRFPDIFGAVRHNERDVFAILDSMNPNLVPEEDAEMLIEGIKFLRGVAYGNTSFDGPDVVDRLVEHVHKICNSLVSSVSPFEKNKLTCDMPAVRSVAAASLALGSLNTILIENQEFISGPKGILGQVFGVFLFIFPISIY